MEVELKSRVMTNTIAALFAVAAFSATAPAWAFKACAVTDTGGVGVPSAVDSTTIIDLTANVSADGGLRMVDCGLFNGGMSFESAFLAS